MNTTPQNPAEDALAAFVLSLAPERRSLLEQAMRKADDPRTVVAEWMAEHAVANIRAGVPLHRAPRQRSLAEILDGLEVCATEDMDAIVQLAQAIRRQSQCAAVQVLAEQIEQLAQECADNLEADCGTAHALLKNGAKFS